MRRWMVAAAIAAALVLALGQAASAAVTTHVSIAFNAGTARFHGSATSSNAECKSHRTVRLFKQTAGGPQLEGRTTTQTNGLWKVEVMHAHGHYYAVVPAQTVMNIHCGSARSGTVDVM